MNDTLTFRITPKNPDFDYKPVLDIWCSYKIEIGSGDTKKTLLYHEWDFVNFCEWATSNLIHWCTEELVIEGYPDACPTESENLCQAIDRLSDTDFENEDDELFWYESIRHYLERHSLQYGLRGARIPGIIIGRQGDYGEISVCDPTDKWAYRFTLRPFADSLIATLMQVLDMWATNNSNLLEINLINKLYDRLSLPNLD